MAKVDPIVLDFESFPIVPRPDYPPKPVSFSLKLPEWRVPRFYAWGHVTGGNNCSLDDARRLLTAVYSDISDERPLLMHNGKFDMDVAYEHFGLQLPPWHRFEDSMVLLFLSDPHQRELGLKSSAARILGMPPEEQDAVKLWILQHKTALESEYPEILQVGTDKDGKGGGIKPSTAGAFIAYAPGTIVGPYANGDVIRTHKLWGPLKKEIVERGMGPAYDRERKCIPIFLRNEREGLRTDGAKLEQDLVQYEKDQATCDAWLRKALKAPTLDLNKDREIVTAFEKADAVTQWSYTPPSKTFPGGQKSISKKNMRLSHFRDPKIAAAYSHRQKCATMLETFIRPWIRYSKNGWMHTNWNLVRQAKSAKSDDTGGTRTGRPSSDKPNFLNMPKKVEEANELAQYKFPAHIHGIAQLPKVRDYILPDAKDHVLGRRDYNQQELRILAHFENGDLLNSYLRDPRLDVHKFLMLKIINDLGLPISRKEAKEMNFGFLYGQGLPSLAAKMDRPVDMVQAFRNAQLIAIPGLKELSDGIKQRSRAGQPIRTFGGREYYVEDPVLWHGRMLDFTYKLINYLIQGSAADVTKESIIRYDTAHKDGRFALTVYDENNISVPKKALKPEMLLLREVMMSIELDVPLISDGEWGPRLGSMAELKEPAPDLSRWGMA